MSAVDSTSTRVVAYYRRSTDHQEASIPEQKEWVRRAARERGLHVVGEFADPGIPGSEFARRPDLQALLAFVEDRARAKYPVQAVVCWTADRLSRMGSFKTAAQIVDRLMSAGCTRMITSGYCYDWTRAEDRVLFNLTQDFMGEGYSKAVSKNVTRSMIARAKEGYWPGSIPAYGYRAEGPKARKVLVPVEPQAGWVRWLFETYAAHGGSLNVLALYLEEHGAPPPRKGWTRYTVWNILTNERYTGVSKFNMTHQGKYHRCVNGAVAESDFFGRQARQHTLGHKSLPRENNDAADVFFVEGAHEPLVSREVFDRVQARLAENKRRTGGRRPKDKARAKAAPWPLSGLMVCGRCGEPMWGMHRGTTKAGKKYAYRYYGCSVARRKGCRPGGCKTNAVGDTEALEGVVRKVQEHLLNPKALARLKARLEAVSEAQAGEAEATREALRQRAARLAEQVATGTRRLTLVPDDVVPGLVKELGVLKAELAEAEQALATLEPSPGPDPQLLEDALSVVGRLHQLIKAADPQAVRAALLPLVAKVTVSFGPGRRGRKGEPDYEVQLTPELTSLLFGRAGRAGGRTRGR
jgi:DNA invertase Pin-like site-specific DNA recombinase